MSAKFGARAPLHETANTVLLAVATNSCTTVPEFSVTILTLYNAFAGEPGAVTCEAVDAFTTAAAFITLEATWGLAPVNGAPPNAAHAVLAIKPMLRVAISPMDLSANAFLSVFMGFLESDSGCYALKSMRIARITTRPRSKIADQSSLN